MYASYGSAPIYSTQHITITDLNCINPESAHVGNGRFNGDVKSHVLK